VLCIGRFFLSGGYKVSRYEASGRVLLALPLLISHVLGKFLNIQIDPEARSRYSYQGPLIPPGKLSIHNIIQHVGSVRNPALPDNKPG